MFDITQEQANRLYEMVKLKVVKGADRDQLLAEIESNNTNQLTEIYFEESAEAYKKLFGEDLR